MMFTMKSKWNINPTDPVTILRLISELEGASYILDCFLSDNEVRNTNLTDFHSIKSRLRADHVTINTMLRKFYRLYFKLNKATDEKTREEIIKACI